MAIHHALPGEVIDIRPLQGKIEGALSKALYKSKRLEVFRLFLVAGKVIPEHRVPGEITVQCLEGCVEFTAADSSLLMQQGDLICVEGGSLTHSKALKTAQSLSPCCWITRSSSGSHELSVRLLAPSVPPPNHDAQGG